MNCPYHTSRRVLLVVRITAASHTPEAGCGMSLKKRGIILPQRQRFLAVEPHRAVLAHREQVFVAWISATNHLRLETHHRTRFLWKHSHQQHRVILASREIRANFQLRSVFSGQFFLCRLAQRHNGASIHPACATSAACAEMCFCDLFSDEVLQFRNVTSFFHFSFPAFAVSHSPSPVLTRTTDISGVFPAASV